MFLCTGCVILNFLIYIDENIIPKRSPRQHPKMAYSLLITFVKRKEKKGDRHLEFQTNVVNSLGLINTTCYHYTLN